MGHTLGKSLVSLRKGDNGQDVRKPSKIVNRKNNSELNVSSWIATDNSIIDNMQAGQNPYIGRTVEVNNKYEDKVNRAQYPSKEKCPVCKKVFNSVSITL